MMSLSGSLFVGDDNSIEVEADARRGQNLTDSA